MRRILFISLFPLLFQVACTQSQLPEDFVIAYNVLYDATSDNYEVFTMNMDGSDKRNITNLPGVEWTYYAWDDKLFFISDKDTAHRLYYLYEMDAYGRNVNKVYDKRLADSWFSSRKDGRELIVRPHPSVDSAFHIISRDGDLLSRVVIPLARAMDPCFVDDGSLIVFRGGTRASKLEESDEEELYIVKDDGSDMRMLTHYPDGDTTAGRFDYRAGPPVWNRSGNFVSYQSKQNGKYSLFGISIDGSHQRKLTDNPQNEGWHSWSPDGNWLAIELFDDEQTQFHVGLMNWITKEMRVLTDTTYKYQQDPIIVRR